LVIALAALVLATGCGGGRSEATHARQGSDLAWLRSYGLWSRRLESDSRAAETLRASLLLDQSGAAAFAVAVNRLGTCADRYTRNVGEPPRTAWRRPAELALRACRRYARGERMYLAAIGHEGTADLVGAQGALDLGGRDFTLADYKFDKTFVWNRPLPRIGGDSSKSRIEPLFSRVATPIARRPVEIRCWSSDDWKKVLDEINAIDPGDADPAGFVGSTAFSHSANLDTWTCDSLDLIAYKHRYPRSGSAELDAAESVQILAHEIHHLVSNGTEAQTECYGMQDLERVARGIGAPPAYARALALRFWQDGYPNDDVVYHTQLCHDGGPLDANPASSRWP
jgi:hypothetical protein